MESSCKVSLRAAAPDAVATAPKCSQVALSKYVLESDSHVLGRKCDMFEAVAAGEPSVAGFATTSASTLRAWRVRTLVAEIDRCCGYRRRRRAGAIVAIRQCDDNKTLTGFSYVDYTGVSLVIATAWAIALAAYRTRSTSVIGAGLGYRRVWTATLVVFGVVAVVSTLFKLDIARGYLAIAFPLGLLALSANRWAVRRRVGARRLDGEFMCSVLAVGNLNSVKTFAKSLARQPTNSHRVVGACVPGITRSNTINIPLTGDIPVFRNDGDIAFAIAASGADTVALTSGNLSSDELQELSWELEKLDVNLVVSPGMADIAGPRLTIQPAGGVALIHVDKPQYNGAKHFQKRMFDTAFAALVLVGVSLLLLVAAIAIKMTSVGPVFYRSVRIGLDGEPFYMIKFRSMVEGADSKVSELASSTRAAAFCSKSGRTRELLRSAVSFAATASTSSLSSSMYCAGDERRRPASTAAKRGRVLRQQSASQASGTARHHRAVAGQWSVRPVMGRLVRLDLSYVANWSMMSDLLLVVGTVRAALRGAGAY